MPQAAVATSGLQVQMLLATLGTHVSGFLTQPTSGNLPRRVLLVKASAKHSIAVKKVAAASQAAVVTSGRSARQTHKISGTNVRSGWGFAPIHPFSLV